MTNLPADNAASGETDAAHAVPFFALRLTPRQKTTIRWGCGGLFLLVIAVFAAGAAGTTEQPTPNDTSGQAIPVTVKPAEMVTSYERERIYTGTLVAKRRSVLSFELAGKVIELQADEGDRVEANQPLARLDTRRLTARSAQAKAELAQAKALLSELKEGPRQQTIAAAEAEVQSLAAQRDVAERRLQRRETLVRRNAISREEYDESLYEFRAAAARTDAGQKTLDELEAGTRVERIEAQRAQVAAIEAQLADIYHQLDDAVLLAPYAGRIVRRRVDEGTVISPGTPIFELIEDEQLEAWVGVPPLSAATIAVGSEVQIAIDGAATPAVVQSVRPELDPETRTRNVVLRLQASEGLVPGQIARVGIRETVAGEGCWVPTAALTPDRRGLWSLLIVDEGNHAAARPVEVIENDGDRSFVRGALQADERVIIEGVHRVVAGQGVIVKQRETTR